MVFQYSIIWIGCQQKRDFEIKFYEIRKVTEKGTGNCSESIVTEIADMKMNVKTKIFHIIAFI